MICKAVDDYIELVRSGHFPVCKEQIAGCDLVERCFQTESIRVDEIQLERYLEQQKYFPFRLLPWEVFVFALHNCVYRADGQLRWPELFIYIGRGGGKNGYLAFESFCWITPINGIRNFDVDIFATAEDQAKTSPDDVREVLETNRAKLDRYFRWNKECITNIKTNSRLRFRTSGYKTKDGGRPGAVAFDEYHAYENYKMVDVATTGLGKKAFPRKTIITTDGYVRGGPLDDLKQQAEDILFRGVSDGGLLPFVCRLDNRNEIDVPALWPKANPSLPYFPVLQQELEREYASYKQNPSAASSFMVKRMNIPVGREEKDVTEWDNIKAANRPLSDLSGCQCVAALDYADNRDFVSAGLLFKKNGIYQWITKTWVCLASKDLPRIKAPLEEWAEKGLLEFVDGPSVSPDIPAAWIEQQAEYYQVTVVGMDYFRHTLMAAALRNHGFDTDKGGANNVLLTKKVTIMRWAPVIADMFANHLIAWGDNPLMNWYVNNTYVETAKDGNMLYMKKDQVSRKTDGFMALVAGICASEQLEDCGEGGVYEELKVYSY